MNREAINKEITEKVFGECWHRRENVPFGRCLRCDAPNTDNQDFFTPEGFFKLWNKIQEKEWYNKFLYSVGGLNFGTVNAVADSFVDPEVLAPAVYDFIKGRTE